MPLNDHFYKDTNHCCISCRHLIIKGERQQCKLSGITRRQLSDATECQKEGIWQQSDIYPRRIPLVKYEMTYSFYETPNEIDIIQTVKTNPFEAFSETDAIKKFFEVRDMHKMHVTKVELKSDSSTNVWTEEQLNELVNQSKWW